MASRSNEESSNALGKKEKALNNRNRKIETASPEMETESQRQNRRTAGGRKKSGSDGTSNDGRGSNH